MASISHRVSIRYPPSPASEPTSTLVLSTPKGYQVDIRLTDTVKPSLEWAFAALSSSTPLPPDYDLPTPDPNANWTRDSLTPSRHAVWKHVLDSREVQDDEGDVFAMNDGRELEVGVGERGRYEEMWRDDQVPAGTEYVALRCVWDDEEGNGWRGLLVRVGRWMQVVYRHVRDGGVRVERCFLGTKSTGIEGIGRERDGDGELEWEIQFESGDGEDVTSGLRSDLLAAKTWVLGREVRVAGVRWQVVDVNE